MLGLAAGWWQGFRTVAGIVGVITAVLAGSTVGLLAGVATDHSLVAALVAGGVVAVGALVVLMRSQQSAWERAAREPLFPDQDLPMA
jgi:hypothetical protein